MTKHIISIDAGNGSVKAIKEHGKGHKQIIFPAVRAAATGDSLGLGNGFELDTEWVEFCGHKYFVGDDVTYSRQPVERHNGKFRYGDIYWTFLVATAIAKLGVKSGDDINLVTFAPPGLYKDARASIEKRMEQLNGKLIIQFKNDKQPRIFTITDLNVQPEGLGAMLNFVIDKQGCPVADNFLAGKNVILDLGMYTADALEITNGLMNGEHLSNATIERGGLQDHLLQPILNALKNQKQRDFDLLGTDSIERVVRCGLTTGDFTLRVGSVETNIEPLVAMYSEKYAKWLCNNIVSGMFDDLRQIKSLTLCGGTAVLVIDHFIQRYGDKVVDFNAHKSTRGVNPVLANAEGGIRLMKMLRNNEQLQKA